MGNGISGRSTGTTARLLAVLVLTGWAVFGLLAPANAAGPPAAAGNDGLIKVFVVPDPSQSGGQLVGLAAIAAGTLNDQSRAGEIFTLNKGLAQPDGSALTDPNQPLHPGWILRLPADASGPAVQLAKDPGGAGGQSGSSTATSSTTNDTGGTSVTFPVPAALAVLGSILLALVTAAIVARRRVAGWLGVIGAAFRSLGDPARRRRRLAVRQSLGQRFAGDADGMRRAYATLGEVAARPAHPPVHALRLDPAGTTVWLSAADTLTSPWQSLDGIRWRRPGAGAGSGSAGASEQAQAESASACLVRVGADPDDQPVFVDLSRLDGVLSVTGDPAVARDVVQNLLAEIARTRPNTPVTVLTSANSPARLTLPAGLAEITRVPLPETGDHHPRGTVRGGAARTPVRGLVVMAGSPTAREAAELVALCGSTGAGWTGLVAGAVDGGAHWRWHTDPDGRLEIPVLGLELTVPA